VGLALRAGLSWGDDFALMAIDADTKAGSERACAHRMGDTFAHRMGNIFSSPHG